MIVIFADLVFFYWLIGFLKTLPAFHVTIRKVWYQLLSRFISIERHQTKHNKEGLSGLVSFSWSCNWHHTLLRNNSLQMMTEDDLYRRLQANPGLLPTDSVTVRQPHTLMWSYFPHPVVRIADWAGFFDWSVMLIFWIISLDQTKCNFTVENAGIR